MTKANAFEGFETFYNNFLMSFKMFKIIIFWSIALYIIGGFIASFFYLGSFASKSMFTFFLSKLLEPVSQFTQKAIYIKWANLDGTVAKVTVTYISKNQDIADFVSFNLSKMMTVYKYSLVIFIIIPFAVYFFKKKARKQSEQKYIKGAKFLTISNFSKILTKNKDTTFLPFGEFVKTSILGKVNEDEAVETDEDNKKEPVILKMPTDCETKHTSVIGRPGSGKTQLFSGHISALKQKEDYKGITYCYKGDYVGKFYNAAKDLLFNPLDIRCLNWELFNEIKTRMDIEMVAGSLFPVSASTNDKDKFFINGAKNVFIGILYYLYNNNLTSNKDIYEHVSKTDEEIVNILKITPGGERGLKNIGNPKYGQASGIFAMLEQNTSCFEYMQEMKGDFSIQDWLENGTGVIYISNYENLKETLKPVLSLFVDLMGRRLLSMPDDNDRSIYFNLDEIHTLQRLGAIVELLTLLRSKGGKISIGTQSYSQLEDIYGKNGRKSIINSCGNNVIMALKGESETKIASELIGDVEFKNYEKTNSMGVSDFKDGISIAPQIKKQPLVMPAEIKYLPELSCLVEFANYHGLMRTRLEYKHYNDINTAFEMRPEFFLKQQANKPLPSKNDNKNDSAGTGPITIEEQVELIDYDKIAEQMNFDENINYDKMADQIPSDDGINNDEIAEQMNYLENN